MIGVVKFMGKFVMLWNVGIVLFMYGLMWLMWFVLLLWNYFDEFGIKLKNVFWSGLFVFGYLFMWFVCGVVLL